MRKRSTFGVGVISAIGVLTIFGCSSSSAAGRTCNGPQSIYATFDAADISGDCKVTIRGQSAGELTFDCPGGVCSETEGPTLNAWSTCRQESSSITCLFTNDDQESIASYLGLSDDGHATCSLEVGCPNSERLTMSGCQLCDLAL